MKHELTWPFLFRKLCQVGHVFVVVLPVHHSDHLHKLSWQFLFRKHCQGCHVLMCFYQGILVIICMNLNDISFSGNFAKSAMFLWWFYQCIVVIVCMKLLDLSFSENPVKLAMFLWEVLSVHCGDHLHEPADCLHECNHPECSGQFRLSILSWIRFQSCLTSII